MERTPVYGIEVFLTIVREGSLRAAAKALGIGAPAVSLQLKALEKRLGVDLLVRTTRSLELTDAGRTLLAGTAPAFHNIVDAVENTRKKGKSKEGILRLSLSRGAYKTVVAPILADFQLAYPEICLDISLYEGLADIVREGFHAGIRVGDLLTTDMVAVRLTSSLTPAFTAAPSYLVEYGRPKHPRDLLNHKCIRYKFISANKVADWQFIEDGQAKNIDPPTRLIFDNMLSVVQAARDGHGIGWSLRSTAEDYLAAGELESVLDAYVKEIPPFYLYYPEQNRRLECLRVFIDFLVANRPNHLHRSGDALLAVSDLLES